MTLRVMEGGNLRAITNLMVKQAGVLRSIRTVKVMDGGALRTVATFADLLTVEASPANVSGTQASASAIRVNTDVTTAGPSGGLAPFSYSWAKVSEVGAANSPSMATTDFGATISPGTQTGTFRVTVTDAVGHTATDDVTATFTNVGGGTPT